MKRLVAFVAVAGCLTAIPLSHLVSAGAPTGKKVFVCHVTGLNDSETRFVGKVIEVSVKAEAAHCRHGDHNPAAGNEEIGNSCGRIIGQSSCGGDNTVDPPWYDPS